MPSWYVPDCGAAKGIACGQRLHHDVLCVIRSAKDWIIAIHRWLLDTGNPVEAYLLTVGMDVIDHRLDIRKDRCVRDRPSVPIEAALPPRIQVDVLKAMLLKAGTKQSVRLCFHRGLR